MLCFQAKLVLAAIGLGIGIGSAGWGVNSATAQTPTPSVVAQPPAAKDQAPNATKQNQSGGMDQYGDPLPPGAVARLGTVRFRAHDEADGLAFASDGKTIAVCSRGGLFLFSADGGKRIKRLANDAYLARQQNSLAFSPDGKRLASWGQAFVSDEKGFRRTKGVVRVSEWAVEGMPREYDAEHLIWLVAYRLD